MNSADIDPGIRSELLDLGAVGLRELRTLDSTPFQDALQHVVNRTRRVRILSRSGGAGGGGGERVD
ncbi:hypothetical protein [Actinophytocola sp.]|uniref:hypothetical protein n=1 Tax=Actinophytocola sp. TaxID=1872138 RepID=UPI003D6C1B4B